MRVAIEKNLPVASGIGGGSANAAAMLRALLRLSGHSPSEAELRALALSLGADVPVCLTQRSCRMRGIGEKIDYLENFGPHQAVLVNPGEALSTVEVFRGMGLAKGQKSGAAIAEFLSVKDCRNDMTASAKAILPAIGLALDALASQPGITVARMSGSGATCFGLFETAAQAEAAAQAIAAREPKWWVKPSLLGGA
jgi:4-diphosphocytidyl-2-C-methyl-D-erythritol kinase